jgi:hypothetical protein
MPDSFGPGATDPTPHATCGLGAETERRLILEIKGLTNGLTRPTRPALIDDYPGAAAFLGVCWMGQRPRRVRGYPRLRRRGLCSQSPALRPRKLAASRVLSGAVPRLDKSNIAALQPRHCHISHTFGGGFRAAVVRSVHHLLHPPLHVV